MQLLANRVMHVTPCYKSSQCSALPQQADTTRKPDRVSSLDDFVQEWEACGQKRLKGRFRGRRREQVRT